MFPYNGGNRLESKTTRMFRPVRQTATPGGKSTVYDCILFQLHYLPFYLQENKVNVDINSASRS